MILDKVVQAIELLLPQGHLTRLQKIVLQETWTGKSYLEMAKEHGYDAGYIKDVGAQLWQQMTVTFGEKVTKQNVKGVLNRVLSQDGGGNFTRDPVSPIKVDWGEAIDVSIFYGRTQELATLQAWLTQDRCRLVTLLGMGGMGKTSLSVKLAEVLQAQFEFVIWRSLRDAPPIDELLTSLIGFLSPQQDIDLPNSTGGKLSRLIELLKRSRCLILLDNFETVLQGGKRAGFYRAGYEMYGELLKRTGEIAHQSCLILTSREKPQEVGILEGDRFLVRTFSLVGLDIMAGQSILDGKGLQGAADDCEQLIAHYRGNPLALKMAATSIQDLFAGNITQFLEQGTVAFSGISNLILQQCDRLSPLEQTIMNWLAINREPVTLNDLQTDIVIELSKPQLLEALESLRWRSLIESSVAGFTQQPVVMESITEVFIEQIAHEIITEQLQEFLIHALIKAQVKDYIRESQTRTILQPLIARLLNELSSLKQLEHKLNRVLTTVRLHSERRPNYGAGNLLNLFRQLEIDLTGYDFSGLSIRQAYLQDLNLHRANFTGAEFVHCAFAATFGGVTSVAFSPDGSSLVASDTNGSIQIWDLNNSKQIARCTGHNSWVWSVVYSPTQPILASCGQDHQVRLWDRSTGQCIRLLEGHTGIATSVTFSPDGQRLASTSGDQTIRLWSMATGECVQTLRGHATCVWSAAFHPDGKTLFSAGEDNVVRQWNIETGQCVQTLVGHQHWVRTISVSPDGEQLVSGSYDQTIKLWEIATGNCVATLSGHYKPVTAVAISTDGQMLVSSSYDQTVKLWCLTTQRCLQTLQKHTNFVWSVALHPTQPLLASGGEDYTARLWNLQTGQCIKTLQGHSNSIYAIALNPTHQLLATGHEDQTLKLWDFNAETLANSASHPPFRTLRGHTGRVISVAFSPDDQLLASGSPDGTVRLWNPHTGHCLKILQGHTSWVWAIAFHPNSQQIASTSYDHTVKLWDVATGECVQTLKNHTSSVLSIAFSPDGQWLASGGYDQTIHLWHPKTGQCLKTLRAHLNRVWSVAFSPNSCMLATGGDDRTVKLWDVRTGECLQTLKGHSSQVLSIRFSPSGDQLISSSADKTIRIWNVTTGDCSAILQAHQHWVWSLTQHPNDGILLSSSQDETVKVWSVKTGTELKTLRCSRPYEEMVIAGATGLTEAQTITLQALGAISAKRNHYKEPRN
jgi:WD40 repeat protein